MRNRKRKVWKLLCTSAILCSACATQQTDAGFTAKDGETATTYGNRYISGIYPHLTTYAHNRVNGMYKFGGECGIGAIAVWQGKMYMINYATHYPKGSEHNLYIVDKDKNMTIFSGSVGGTPAARMIHRESEQLLMGHYLIDKQGNIRTIPIDSMPGRITAIARHLDDPVNKAYYYDMEGKLYEANVHTLEIKKLFNNPLPGWHGKGGYTAQGKLFLANNGESGEKQHEWQVSAEGQTGPGKYGVLAEYDGKGFKVIERKQFTDITTRHGIDAAPDDNSPLWTMGWDKRSIRLKVLENEKWSTYLLPKATYNNDPSHGWFTEWPRIREIGDGKMMMDMHGMFYEFPSTFSIKNSAGIKPIASHLRYIPDFCSWNGQIVLATDETSIQGNPLSGQPQSNLWFGTMRDIRQWGPASGYGCIWLNDSIESGQPSLPYLLSGFDNRTMHVINHSDNPLSLLIQIDEKGDDNWTDYQTMQLDSKEYKHAILPPNIKGEWLRIIPQSDGKATVSMHYTTSQFQSGKSFKSLFDGLADIDYSKEIIGGKLFSNRSNYNLSCFSNTVCNNQATERKPFEFQKYTFNFKPGITDTLAKRALDTKVHYSEKMNFNSQDVKTELKKELWDVDEASVILHTSKGNLRLPKGNIAFDLQKNNFRAVREVESEREVAQIHGTFYELPLSHVGKEPLFDMMRPISSHNKWIEDYNTWNGLLVMAGIEKDADTSEHIYKNQDNTAGLWMGGIDDLWKLGKPVGQGGPWKDTAVEKDAESDPYLMTGYDDKTLTLKADKDVNITLYLNVAHYLEQKVPYKTFALKAGETMEYHFPKGFSAHWATLVADNDCVATAQFIYK